MASPAARALPADGQPTVLLEAKPGATEIEPGKLTDVWGFGARVPGPVMTMKPGEEFRLRLVNSVPRPLGLHFHGLRIPSEFDGVAGLGLDPAAPSGSMDLRLTPPDSGTFLYRPMVAGFAGEEAERGIGGVCVVEERVPYPVDLDRVLAVDDWLLGEDGQLAPFGGAAERGGPGRLGNRITVNGTPVPQRVTVAPGSRVRLRLANLCNARVLRIRFDGMKAYVIAVDGQPTDTFEPLRSMLPFAPGTRYDVVLDVPDEPGWTGRIVALIGDGITLSELRGEGAKKASGLPPIGPLAPNTALPGAISLEKSQRADVVMEGGARPGPDGRPIYAGDPERIWRVNGTSGPVASEKSGKVPNFGKPLISVRRGTPVVLALANRTAYPQVIHVAGQVFRLLHALDDGWEPYWLDNVIVPEGQTARIAFIPENRGRYLVGSSLLDCFDTGLSTWIEVT
jgi:FtsP/CotA-like multicopper oxidase with cupredoxin domain